MSKWDHYSERGEFEGSYECWPDELYQKRLKEIVSLKTQLEEAEAKLAMTGICELCSNQAVKRADVLHRQLSLAVSAIEEAIATNNLPKHIESEMIEILSRIDKIKGGKLE